MSEKNEHSEQLSAYLDGQLAPEEVDRLERALAGDPELARELASLRAARELLRRLPRVKAGEDFTAEVLEKVERRRLMGTVHGAGKWYSDLPSLAAAAIVLMAVTIGIGVIVQLSRMDSFQDTMARNGTSVTDNLSTISADKVADVKKAERTDTLALAGARKEEENLKQGSSFEYAGRDATKDLTERGGPATAPAELAAKPAASPVARGAAAEHEAPSGGPEVQGAVMPALAMREKSSDTGARGVPVETNVPTPTLGSQRREIYYNTGQPLAGGGDRTAGLPAGSGGSMIVVGQQMRFLTTQAASAPASQFQFQQAAQIILWRLGIGRIVQQQAASQPAFQFQQRTREAAAEPNTSGM